MSVSHLGIALFVLFVLTQNTICATVNRENRENSNLENLNAEINDDAAEDLTDDETPEPEPEVVTTTKPVPLVRMPASSDLKADPKLAKTKVFSQKKQYYNGQVELWPPRMPHNSEFDILETQAFCYETEITLFLKFNTPFHGYVYPYHHFKRCHLFTGSGETEVNLVTDKTSCGMDVVYSTSKSNISFMEFTVMIQWDSEFLGQSDRKLRVTCNRPHNDRRPVAFNSTYPIVAMEIEADSEDEAEMALPENSTSAKNNYDRVRLGDAIDVSFTVDLYTITDKFDAQVIKCVAHDGLQDDDRKIATYSSQNNGGTFTYDGSKVLLADGCSVAPAYFTAFEKDARETTIILNSEFRVFRFPSSSFVFLSCDIRICRGECPPQQDCSSKLKTEPAIASEDQKVITLYRPLLVKLGSLGAGSSAGEHHDAGRSKVNQGLPTASFIAGLIGMGFVCAIVCVFMYRRFKKGTEKDYKMQYSPNSDRSKDEVAPLKVTTGAAGSD